MRVLVTGATGFVGRAVCRMLHQAGYVARAVVRDGRQELSGASEIVAVPTIGRLTDWRRELVGVDHILHLAGKAHDLQLRATQEADYYEVNEYGTRRLAEVASQSGVQRFIYLSSVKVNGEETETAYCEDSVPQPAGVYGRSKWLGERALMEYAGRGGMEVAVVRSPLIYGPGVRANFLRLLQSVERGWPLPFGGIKNSRSIISVWNICNLLLFLLASRKGPGRVWMASDGVDVSTPELIHCIARGMGRRVSLLPVPPMILRGVGSILGKRREFERLCGSLRIDISRTRGDLGWSPPFVFSDSIERTVSWYLHRERDRFSVKATL